MLFGGADDRQVVSNLWAWDGKRWKCLANGGPPPRTFASLAYDVANRQLLLFGGNRVLFGSETDTPGFLNDMWAWDDGEWRQIHGDMPPARAEASMVYDSNRQRLVLFGGYRMINGQVERLGDTWEWDGIRWVEKSRRGPSPRNGAAMAYDFRRQRVVLYGGNGASAETWEWDGWTWGRMDTEHTPGRFNSVMSYDADRGNIVRFGGWNGDERVGDTWSYDGRQWKRLLGDGPAPRNHSAMVFDEARNVFVLFGGHDGERIYGDTWEWTGLRWNQVAGGTPRLRVDNGH